MKAISIGIILGMGMWTVLLLHARQKNRTVPEILVDFLYRWAAFWGCLAEACDAGLLRFRETRERIRQTHVPLYQRVAGGSV